MEIRRNQEIYILNIRVRLKLFDSVEATNNTTTVLNVMAYVATANYLFAHFMQFFLFLSCCGNRNCGNRGMPVVVITAQ